ncbi:hypothetical protein AB0K41_40985 [Actinomadura coerulea]
MGGTPVRCGASRTTVHRSGLGEIAGYGRDKSHHAFSWGAKLMLVTTAEGAVCAFSLAHPKELDERKQAVHLLHGRLGTGSSGPGIAHYASVRSNRLVTAGMATRSARPPRRPSTRLRPDRLTRPPRRRVRERPRE